MATLLGSRVTKLERATRVNEHVRYVVLDTTEDWEPSKLDDWPMTEDEWVEAFAPSA